MVARARVCKATLPWGPILAYDLGGRRLCPGVNQAGCRCGSWILGAGRLTGSCTQVGLGFNGHTVEFLT